MKSTMADGVDLALDGVYRGLVEENETLCLRHTRGVEVRGHVEAFVRTDEGGV